MAAGLAFFVAIARINRQASVHGTPAACVSCAAVPFEVRKRPFSRLALVIVVSEMCVVPLR